MTGNDREVDERLMITAKKTETCDLSKDRQKDRRTDRRMDGRTDYLPTIPVNRAGRCDKIIAALN